MNQLKLSELVKGLPNYTGYRAINRYGNVIPSSPKL